MSKQNAVEDIYPLSASQQGMLFHLLFAEEKGQVYFDQYVSTLVGPLDTAAFRQAWNRTLERHPALRTQFLWERREQPLQVVRRDAVLPWQEHDWSALPEAEREERLAAFLREDHDLGFDLGKPPLARVAVIRWAEDVHKLVWSFHHLIVDGWSMGLVLADAFAFYRELRAGREVKVVPPRPYRDYINWVQGQDPARAEAFWRLTLAGFDTANPLPFDGTGAGGDPTGWVAREAKLEVPAETAAALKALARGQQITLNTVFQGAWSLLLSRYAASSDVTFGAIVSGRPPEIEGVEQMVGLFINLLPVRVDASPDQPVLPWLKALQEQQTEQREHEHTPLEQVMAWSEVGRKGILFETVLVFENYPVDALRQGASDMGLKVQEAHLSESGNFPLTLYALPKSNSVEMRLNYHWTRISPASADRILSHLLALLQGLVAMPAGAESRLGDLRILAGEERLELLAAGRGPVREDREAAIHSLFEEQAARTPEATALETTAGARLTYGELADRSDRLARHLRSLGVGPESVVGLCVERSPEMVVGMLGVLKAGGTYLPLDPAYPQERLAFMLEDSGARLVLAQERLEPNLPASAPRIVRLDADWPESGEALPEVDPRQPAYIIYTSGSTGRPKGVLVPHSSLVNYVRHAGAAYGIGAGDRVLQFASMSFDTSAEEIYPCLTGGGTLVLRDDEMAGSLDRFSREAGRLGITVLDLPTAYWHEWVAEMAGSDLSVPGNLRVVILGGEEAQADRLATWRERVGQRVDERVRLFNTYGPTEATIVSTWCDLTHGAMASPLPIGKAVPNARAYVLDRSLDLVPAGVVGELYLGGAGLARGYLGRPELTADRFLPDPFASEGGHRLYRTGDLARLRPDGDLEFRGRADDQVKVRGFRIELGEIESALRRQPGVRDAVVVAREDNPGQKRLVAYVVPSVETAPTPPSPSVTELRQALKELLPDYMVPSAFMVLEALPMTPSGKVNRRALPTPDAGRPELDASYIPPHTPVQQMLAEMWSDLLGFERVGIHDDFFQLGGHSLLVAKLAARIRQAFKVELSLIEVFKNPTISQLAEAVEKPGMASELPELPPIRRVPRDGRAPLSYPQERVWFLDQLTPGGNIAYNFQFTLWVRGPLRVDLLDRTLTEIVRRHEVLRTSFPAVDGRPVQVVHEPWAVSLPVIDLRELPRELRHAESERLVFESTQTPFDVSRIPLLRWRMLQLEDDLWEMVQVEQHFVHDGWSFGVFLREIKALYTAYLAGEPSPLPELPVQFSDFATWQHELVEGPSMERLLGFWKKTLSGSSGVLELPADRPRPNRPSFAGDITLFRLPVELYDALRTFSRREGFTLYMTTLAGFFTLLYRYTGQEDILLGTNNANRRAREVENLIGMIVNTLVVRGNLAGDPDFRGLLGRVRETSLETYAHQDMPFERLVQEIRPERQIGRNPLFQVMFNFHDAAVPDLEFADLEAAFRVRGNRSAKMDMNVILVPGAEQRVGLAANELDKRAVLHWEYNTELFDFPTVQRMIGHFMNLLTGAIENPKLKLSELPLLTAGERRQVVEEWNDTALPERIGGLLHEPFEAQAAQDPSRVAVRFEGRSLSYGELNDRANRLAHALRRLGVGPEILVGLSVERSLDMLVGLLGILKAGGAYVPLDPSYPADRLAYVVADARVPVLLIQSALRQRLDFQGTAQVLVIDDGFEFESAENLAPLAGPENLAYAIYTSGSTGRPKGVGIPHRAAANFLTSMARRPGLAASDTLVAVTTLSFDIAVLELFLPLAVGARIELAGRETAADGPRLAALLASSGATAMQATPATWRVLIESGWEGDPRLKALCGGEALPRDLADALLARVGSLWNVYGPTETTVWSALHPVSVSTGETGRPVPIGRPIANTSIHLLDWNLEPVPQNIPGELYIGGEGVARGYLGRPDLTAERFVPDPYGHPGSRRYRTGDLARFLVGGVVEFLGRADHQVKVRGFRIELGEIESVLNAQPQVRESVVVARPDASGDARLVAYVVSSNGSLPDLREPLGRKLPDYMVPSVFVELPELPLTPNGKVDRKALPSPEGATLEVAKEEYVEPRTPVETTLAGIWAEVLGVERVGSRDNFFSLGGHSLTATRVLSRVRGSLGVDLPLSLVFEKRTVEGMAMVIEEKMASAVSSVPELGEDDLLAQAATLSDAELDALLLDTLTEGGQA